MAIDVIGFGFAYFMIMYVFRKYFFGTSSSPSSVQTNQDAQSILLDRSKNVNISNIHLDESEKKQVLDQVSDRGAIPN